MTPTSTLSPTLKGVWVLLGLLVSDCELSRLKLSVNSHSLQLHAYYLEKLGICEVFTSVEEASRISFLFTLSRKKSTFRCLLDEIILYMGRHTQVIWAASSPALSTPLEKTYFMSASPEQVPLCSLLGDDIFKYETLKYLGHAILVVNVLYTWV